MRNWGWGVSCLGYSLQIAELIFVLHCVWFKTSMLFLFSLWQLFTDEKKALGSGWDTIKQECGLLIPLVEENHLPTLLWVVSEKETFIMFKPLYWIGQKVCSGFSFCCCSVRVVSDSLRSHGLQHTRLPGPSLSRRVCSNSHPLSQWCLATISSSVVPFSSCPQSFPA